MMYGDPDNTPKQHELPTQYGEVIGWRTWRIWRHGNLVRLTSINSVGRDEPTIWQPRKMLEAICPKGHDHHVPSEGCTCGFYTALDPEHLTQLGYSEYDEGDVVVYGKVALAGKVIPGSQGWKSQYAWPLEVWVPTHEPKLVPLLSKQYGIPVHTGNLVYTRKREGMVS